MSPMPAGPTSRAEALRAAGLALALGYEVLERAPLEEAVEAALSPTGPSREEVRARIVAYRARLAASSGRPA